MPNASQDPDQRMPWSWGDDLAPDVRQARATEYMAYYLARIEQHLGQIVEAIHDGALNENLRAELSKIAEEMREKPVHPDERPF